MASPTERVVKAEYYQITGNPYLDAMPGMVSQTEFYKRVSSRMRLPTDVEFLNPEERRKLLTGLTSWFLPMGYMYNMYDMLYRAVITTYQTKTVVEAIQQMNGLYVDSVNGYGSRMQYGTQAFSGAVLGVPGIGKSSTLQRCLSLMPQVIRHTNYQGQKCFEQQINYLFVECPSDCSVKTLVFNVLSAIDRAIESNYIGNNSFIKGNSASALTSKLKIICMNHHIGLIVIDEIQNAVTTAREKNQLRPLIKFLVELTNETNTGICFCGTLEAEDLFLSQEHLKRRTRGFRLLPMKFDISYRKFITELWKYQVVLKPKPLTEALMKQLFDLSGGIPAYIVKIFSEAQADAIITGVETLNFQNMKTAVERASIVVPKTFRYAGTSISDFMSMQDIVETSQEGDTAIIKSDEEDSATVLPEEPKASEMPAKRFYATTRGRRKVERDDEDVIIICKKFKVESDSIKQLEVASLLERRTW